MSNLHDRLRHLAAKAQTASNACEDLRSFGSSNCQRDYNCRLTLRQNFVPTDTYIESVETATQTTLCVKRDWLLDGPDRDLR